MRNAIFIIAVIVVAVAGFLGYQAWSSHHTASSRTQLASGYATQALSAPFTLQSKTWQGDHWEYRYVAAESEAQALADAKAQFGRGAYQVVSGKPDTTGSDQATLYRDLITEDVAVKAQIGPTTSSSTPVTLYLSPIEGK